MRRARLTTTSLRSRLARYWKETSPRKVYSVPLGGVCYRDRQCVPSTPTDSPNDITYCADNGQYWDGDFNCCRYSGGACFGGSGCCGALLCTDGVCQ